MRVCTYISTGLWMLHAQIFVHVFINGAWVSFVTCDSICSHFCELLCAYAVLDVYECASVFMYVCDSLRLATNCACWFTHICVWAYIPVCVCTLVYVFVFVSVFFVSCSECEPLLQPTLWLVFAVTLLRNLQVASSYEHEARYIVVSLTSNVLFLRLVNKSGDSLLLILPIFLHLPEEHEFPLSGISRTKLMIRVYFGITTNKAKGQSFGRALETGFHHVFLTLVQQETLCRAI